jgi:hypothetical protein
MSNRESDPTLEFVAQLKVTIAPALSVGNIGHGIREVIPITGGTIVGPRLTGKVIPGGADWGLDLGDGGYRVTARYTLELDDGTLISVVNRGTVHEATDGHFVGRTIPQFEVQDGPHDWLRQNVFVGTLDADSSGKFVTLKFYRVT